LLDGRPPTGRFDAEIVEDSPSIWTSASPGRIRNDVLRQGLRLMVAATVIGAIGALALARLLGTPLYQVTAFDPPSFVAPALALGSIALVACCLAAVRAARADPVSAPRDE
jgi:hypothetical protein